MTNLTYIEAAKIVLEKAEMPLKTAEIWHEIERQNLDKQLSNIAKTPIRSLHTILLNHTKSDGEICVFSENPRTYCLNKRKNELNKNRQDFIEKIQKKEEQEQKGREERKDLHPLLVKFLRENEYFQAYSKTIRQETSKAKEKGINVWIHPDIVGVHFAFDDFKDETVNLLKNTNKSSYNLYSFEVKWDLDHKFKEYYFQAVSNSSWANEGYLVVFDDIDPARLEEIERLNDSFGIGLIKLDANIKDSEILLKAKRKELDIKTIDKLMENKDFAEFIKHINSRVKTHGENYEIKSKFDEILSDDELEKHIKERKIQKK